VPRRIGASRAVDILDRNEARQPADPGRRQIGRGKDRDHPGGGAGGRRIEPLDPGMRMG
jgi:hypothetical protein